MLTAAARCVDVTPPPGHPMGGYLLRRNAVSTGTHDPLTATFVHLAGGAGGTGVLWVMLDALGIDASIAGRIRSAVAAAAGVDVDSVLVCASHTHSGPDAWLPGPYSFTTRAPDEGIVDGLVERLGTAAAGLGEHRRPVVASWGTATGVGVGTNRNDPGGPHDDTAGVLALYGDGGEPVAVVVDYACHPTVLGHANLRYSADFPGAARTVATATLHSTARAAGLDAPAPVVAFLQGAAGDASTRFTRREQSFAEAARLGGLLGAAAARGALAGQGEPVHAVPVVHRDTVELPVRPLPSPAEAREQVARTEAAWRRVDGRAGTPEGRIARSRYEGALFHAALRDAGLPARMCLPIAVVALGDVAWVHLPVELFASFAAALKEASPFPYTRVVGYADGYFGYVADAAAHDAGSYEARSSLFDAAAGTHLVEAAARLLERSRTGTAVS